MASVYFHIPYCRKACTYCNFHFSTQLKGFESMVQAMEVDWNLQQNFLSESTVESIYFGGGTPSVLPLERLEKLISIVTATKQIHPEAEITLEANPEDIHSENLIRWKQLGINRISLGVQSLNDEELRWMNRAHSARESRDSVDLILQHTGFQLSVDLIYGSHLKSDEQWLQELEWVNQSGVHHLSCYALTVEEKTALYKIQSATNLIKDEHSTQHFQILSEWAHNNAWNHYEISNLSRTEETRAKHNQRYWHGGTYWGIGPGAHAYNGQQRRWNLANNNLYTKYLLENTPDLTFEVEELSRLNKFNERLMTHLRLSSGIKLDDLSGLVEPKTWEKWIHETSPLLDRWALNGQVIRSNSHLILTAEGRWFADAISADLMLVEED